MSNPVLHLPAGAPYDGPRLLSFLGAHAVPGVEQWDGTSYTRSVRTSDGPVVVRLTVAAEGITADLTTPATPDVRQRLEHLVATATTTAAAEDHLADDDLLGASVRARPGLRSPGSIDDGETLVRTVIGQQVSLAGARTVLGRISTELGEPLPGDLVTGSVTTLFPTMTALADSDPLLLPMPRARARAVVACAGAVVRAGGLPSRPDLLALAGVGPWTTDYVDLRCRRDPDVFLPTDLAVRRELERRGLDAGPLAVTQRARTWAPYRSTALIHLWTSYLEGQPTD